jgi:outer membrane immunogenic protein
MIIRAIKRLLLAATALAAFAVPALAADMALKAPPAVIAYNWTGFYAGIEGGGAWGNHRFINEVGVDTSSNLHGGLVGGDIGYNYQSGVWVFGVEADLSWADLSGSTFCANPTFRCGAKVDWFGTGRVRIGRAFDRLLPYVTGGFAYGDIVRLNSGNFTVFEPSRTAFGWTIGAGVDYALSAAWSLRAEYLYVDLTKETFPGAVFPGLALYGPAQIDARFHVVRAALNFKF